MRTDTVWSDAAQQTCCRALLQATARPGTVHHLASGDQPAWMLVAATLLDGAVTLADPDHLLAAEHWPFIGAQQVSTETAAYILADGSRAPSFQPALGTLDQPHLGATVLVVVAGLGDGPLHVECQGPGIPHQHNLRLSGLDPGWISARNQWTRRFPMGVDLLLADDQHVAALPRTTRTTHITGGV